VNVLHDAAIKKKSDTRGKYREVGYERDDG
jgi:hypothetical protein